MFGVRTKDPRFVSIDGRIAKAYAEYCALMILAERDIRALSQAEEHMNYINQLLDVRLNLRHHEPIGS